MTIGSLEDKLVFVVELVVALVVAFVAVVFDCAVAADITKPDAIMKPNRAVVSKAKCKCLNSWLSFKRH